MTPVQIPALVAFVLANPEIATGIIRESIEVVKLVPDLFKKAQGGLEYSDEEIMAAVKSEHYLERKKKILEQMGLKEEPGHPHPDSE